MHAQAVAIAVLLLLLILPTPAQGEFKSVIRELFPWYYEDHATSSKPNLVVQAAEGDAESSGMHAAPTAAGYIFTF